MELAHANQIFYRGACEQEGRAPVLEARRMVRLWRMAAEYFLEITMLSSAGVVGRTLGTNKGVTHLSSRQGR